ncbi:MAG: SipW-dependent-type signal peptide-containing protein [Anaerovoracaceae bacterium]
MSKTKKTILMLACAVMLVLVSVMGTMAYLTSTDIVTNTFTVGKVAITLDEAKVDTDGIVVTGSGAGRVKANSYKLMPGHEYTKDPTIHVSSDSEESWLFVKVENGISAIEDTASTIAAQMAAKGWTPVNGETNVYAYNTKVTANAEIKVFEKFKIAGDAATSNYANAQIKVTAYAVQADTFATAEAAWAAAPLS